MINFMHYDEQREDDLAKKKEQQVPGKNEDLA